MRTLGLMSLFFISMQSIAETADMKFHGILIEPPPCHIKGIDGGKMIDVDFGDRVGINKVNGINYLQTVPYQIECDDNPHKFGLTLEIIATATAFDPMAIKSNIDSFGIRVYQGSKVFELNRPISITKDNQPTLTAVPVKDVGQTLEPKPFTATATLVAAYQ